MTTNHLSDSCSSHNRCLDYRYLKRGYMHGRPLQLVASPSDGGVCGSSHKIRNKLTKKTMWTLHSRFWGRRLGSTACPGPNPCMPCQDVRYTYEYICCNANLMPDRIFSMHICIWHPCFRVLGVVFVCLPSALLSSLRHRSMAVYVGVATRYGTS